MPTCPPESIVELITALDDECDIVIGSRYLAGSSVDRSWGPWRFMVSSVATTLARPLLNCSDPMSGFFAIRCACLPELGRLHPIGYKIGPELIVRGHLRVTEVPIRFPDRSEGHSKMTWRQQVKLLGQLVRRYWDNHRGVARAFCLGLVGESGLIIDISCYLWLRWTGIDHRSARFLSFWPAVT